MTRSTFSFLMLLAAGLPQLATAQQTVSPFGVPVPALTLSGGRYDEFFAHDSLQRIGSVVYNTRLRRVAALLSLDSLDQRPSPETASRWLSVDPLAAKFAFESPYTYVSSNPVNKTDPDGRSGIATIDQANHTVTISSSMIFYGNAGSQKMAQKVANNVQNQWNAAQGQVMIHGECYTVKFAITGEYKANLTAEEVRDNKNYENNYVLLQSTRPSPGYYDHSHYDSGGNRGVFWTKEMEDGSNTDAHEYGHGLEGPNAKYNGRSLIKGHPASANGVEADGMGEGRPGIMYPRGSLVDDAYAMPDWGNYIDVKKRAVNQHDIDFLGLDKLQYNADGKANVGQPLPANQGMVSDPAKK